MYLSYSRDYSISQKRALKRQIINNINFASGSFNNKQYYLEQIEILNNRLDLLQKKSFLFKLINHKVINNLKNEINDFKFKLNLIEDENI